MVRVTNVISRPPSAAYDRYEAMESGGIGCPQVDLVAMPEAGRSLRVRLGQTLTGLIVPQDRAQCIAASLAASGRELGYATLGGAAGGAVHALGTLMWPGQPLDWRAIDAQGGRFIWFGATRHAAVDLTMGFISSVVAGFSHGLTLTRIADSDKRLRGERVLIGLQAGAAAAKVGLAAVASCTFFTISQTILNGQFESSESSEAWEAQQYRYMQAAFVARAVMSAAVSLAPYVYFNLRYVPRLMRAAP